MPVQLSTINPQDVSTLSDKQRRKAIRFASADEKTIDRLAHRRFNREYGDDINRTNKRLNVAIKSIPLVAVASSLAAGRSGKAAVASGVTWGLAIAAPEIVNGVQKLVSKKGDKDKKQLPLWAHFGASLATFFGLTSLANAVFTHPKIANSNAAKAIEKHVMNAEATVAKAYYSVASKVKVPQAVKNVVGKVNERIPAPVKEGWSRLAGSETFAKVSKGAKNIGSKALQNAPMLVMLSTLAAVVGKSFSYANKAKNIKDAIKEDQAQTAKYLVSGLAVENEILRAENADLKNS